MSFIPKQMRNGKKFLTKGTSKRAVTRDDSSSDSDSEEWVDEEDEEAFEDLDEQKPKINLLLSLIKGKFILTSYLAHQNSNF